MVGHWVLIPYIQLQSRVRMFA